MHAVKKLDHFWSVHGIMNTSGIVQIKCIKWFLISAAIYLKLNIYYANFLFQLQFREVKYLLVYADF